MIIDYKKRNTSFIEENKKLYVIKNEINKQYSAEILKTISKDKLNLHFSNVKQIKDIDDVFSK